MSPGPRLQIRRSRRGCLTCRIRRVKCDETQPECLKCIQTGRKCEGPEINRLIIKQYQPKLSPTRDIDSLAFRRPISPLFTSPGEIRAFDFYLQHAAPSIARDLDGGFWARLLPQLCHHDSAIRSAVLALSVFYEHPIQDADIAHYSGEQSRGMYWYKQSITAAMTPPTSRDEVHQLEHSLLTCMLFAIIEMQHANSSNAMRLLGHGFNLISQYLRTQPQGHRSASPWISVVLPMFGRQILHIGIFRSELAPRYHATIRHLLPMPSKPILTLTDARDNLYSAVHESIQLAAADRVPESAKGACERHVLARQRYQQRQILQWLEMWEHRMRLLERNTAMSTPLRGLFHALFCYQKVITIWIFWLFSPPNNLALQDPVTVNEILEHAEAALDYTPHGSSRCSTPPFVLELGVIPALCFIAWQCQKDQRVSQRAAELLRRAPSQENMYVARLQADAIGRVLAIEPTLAHRSSQDEFSDDVFASSYSWERMIDEARRGVRPQLKHVTPSDELRKAVDARDKATSPLDVIR